MNSHRRMIIALLAIVAAEAICGPSLSAAAVDPQPSPLYSQSLEESVQRMNSESVAGKRRELDTVATPGGVSDTTVACIYQLLCAKGNPDTLAQMGLKVGDLRRGARCSNGEHDCIHHVEDTVGSVCLIWQYVTCAPTDLPPMPALPFALCPCDSLSTMQATPTCQVYTCRTSTCMGSGGGFSCAPQWLETLACGGPTCLGNSTCEGATCYPELTCQRGPTCFSTCAPAQSTCSGNPSCDGTATCSFPTCHPSPTCAGELTCGFATCMGATCQPNATCIGMTTCGYAPTCTRCDCSHLGDVNADGRVNVLDILRYIGRAFLGNERPFPSDMECPGADRGDLDCDGVDTIADLVILIDRTIFGAPKFCNPCTNPPHSDGAR